MFIFLFICPSEGRVSGPCVAARGWIAADSQIPDGAGRNNREKH